MKLIHYPASFHQIAKQIGHARRIMNNKTHLKKYDRGNKNDFVDYIGALGELVFLHYLIEKGIKYQMVKMVDSFSSKNPDFIVRGKRLDVKTKYDNYPSLIINLESHQKSKRFVDFYVFIHIQTEKTANMHIFQYNEIDNWKTVSLKYAVAKSYNLKS